MQYGGREGRSEGEKDGGREGIYALVNIVTEWIELKKHKKNSRFTLFVAALRNRAGHYIFACGFYLSFYLPFFRRLISAVADWMSAVLPHMMWP